MENRGRRVRLAWGRVVDQPRGEVPAGQAATLEGTAF